MDSPRLRFENYPSGLSGGMCQRAMIGMALSSEPSLLIADEPTTGLDATIQSKIVGLLAELKSEYKIATLLISHDIRVISRLADNVAGKNGGAEGGYGPGAPSPCPPGPPPHPHKRPAVSSRPERPKRAGPGG